MSDEMSQSLSAPPTQSSGGAGDQNARTVLYGRLVIILGISVVVLIGVMCIFIVLWTQAEEDGEAAMDEFDELQKLNCNELSRDTFATAAAQSGAEWSDIYDTLVERNCKLAETEAEGEDE